MNNETIVDRVVDRIKKQPLGDLIVEEDLYDIIKQAIPKAFFEKRYIQEGSGYNQKMVEKEPVIVQALRESLEANVRECIKTWTVENGEIVAEYWKKVMDEKLLNYVQKMQDEQATRQVRDALSVMIQAINHERSSKGMPHIYL